ncbi:MAG TPA: hypothetical protein VJ827_05750 [Rubrobacter sp.]|nr:hypothetical protein [Rubrobacter sp.]
MPEWRLGERHKISVDATPEQALESVARVTPGEMPLVRLLFAVRSVPARKTEPLLQQMLDFGFILLTEEAHREVLFGVGQMFELNGGAMPPIGSTREFLVFDRPGYARGAMNILVAPTGVGTRMSTETGVLTTDAKARRRVGRYWRVIRPGSAAIRRGRLRAVKRRAGCGSMNVRP